MTESLTSSSAALPEASPDWKRLLRNAAVYLAIWFVLLVVLVAQTSWGTVLSWPLAMVKVVRIWAPWVVLGPLLWWLVKRFPLFGGSRIRHLGVHLLACLVMIALAEVLVAFVVFPITKPVLAQAIVSEQELARETRGNRPRPIIRNNDYRLRSRQMVRKAQLWLLLYWVFALISTAVLQRRAAEEKTRRELALQGDLVQARFRELQSRLNPHFLFNALNSIAALIQVDPEKAEEMVTRLSTLLRKVLASGEQLLIPLSKELSLLRDYLAIEQVRFPDRLSIVESIDEATLDCLVPPLTLQPIAENAIKHGIEPKGDPSQLEIIAKLEVDRVTLEIIDNGIGSNGESQESGLGIGLQNVRGRLDTVFPGEAELSVNHPVDGGTAVAISIPKTEEGKESE
ncbi:MAG: histidine kinase [Verrucomicrobiota bacterium]